jgi:hypothetical protein
LLGVDAAATVLLVGCVVGAAALSKINTLDGDIKVLVLAIALSI